MIATPSPDRQPRRVQMSRKHPWRADNPDAVIVARPSRWGNPYAVGAWVRVYAEEAAAKARPDGTPFPPSVIQDPTALARERRIPDYWVVRQVPDAASAVAWFRDLIAAWQRDDEDAVEAWLLPLAGRDLACWCPLDQPCHADVLLEIANAPEGGE